MSFGLSLGLKLDRVQLVDSGAPPAIAPSNDVAPVVSGSAVVGQTLTTTDGTWSGTTPITFTYQWQRDSVNISGATSSTYLLVQADADKDIRCVVTATNSAGSDNANSIKRYIYDENAFEYLGRVEGPSGDNEPLELGVRKAVNKFVVGTKEDGIWNSLSTSCIMAGAKTLNGAIQPLVGPALNNLNFLASDYDRVSGLKGNGTTKRLNTNVRVSNFSGFNNFHLSAYVTEPPTTGGWFINDANGGAGTCGIGRSAAGGAVARAQTSTILALKAAFGLNFIGVSRNNSSNFTHLLELASEVTATQASQALSAANLYVFADGTATPNYTNARIAFYSAGNSLSLTSLRSRLITLMSSIDLALSSYDVFFVAGQSNSDGRVLTDAIDTPSYVSTDTLLDSNNNPIKVWNGTSISDYVFGSNGPSGNGKYFVSLSNTKNWGQNHVALHLLSQVTTNPILIVQVTEGGTMLSPLSRASNNKGSWSSRFADITNSKVALLTSLKNRYEALETFAASNNIQLNPKALLWHQGEADYDVSINTGLTVEQRQSALNLYEQELEDMISYFRTEITGENTPVFSGTVPAASGKYSAAIRAAMLNYAASDPNTYWLDTDGLTLFDGLHFGASANIIFGTWIYEKYAIEE